MVTDQNQFWMGLSGQKILIQCKRAMSCSFSNLLKAIDDQSCLQSEYPELSRMLFGKQGVSRKKEWNRLSLRCQSSRRVWPKRRNFSNN